MPLVGQVISLRPCVGSVAGIMTRSMYAVVKEGPLYFLREAWLRLFFSRETWFKLLLIRDSWFTVKISFHVRVNAIFDFNVSCERRVELNVIREKLFLREIISGCLCTFLSSVHGQTNADTRQHKNSSNFQMATISYVCQLSLISIRKQIKSVVLCVIYSTTLKPTNYVTSPKA